MTRVPVTPDTHHLAVIDMQVVFADPASGWATPGFAEILPRVRELVAALAPQVTFTRFVAPAAPEGAWRQYYAEWPFALQPPDAPLYDLVPGFPPAAAVAPTVTATTFSKWGPDLAAAVGSRTLLLAGVSTDCCVLSTALAAADAGVPVQVVADACAGVDAASHAAALHVMGLYAPLVEVVDTAVLVTGAAG
ncbi:cysteine hydrolase family protein [Pseudonocardia kunmingensis]|uniref:Nicotinamidase-related amidase n=1 Tax=Pseudonocardia kunmingensis TaxID=630975 RepID=A0A543D128_9PSEU|nr:cysteine hydrolase [Pseudonocardia kunmingensis]TQM03056.1 nicotinamidase-related amidase [Pseudonocardia kunmingensis]